MIVPARLAFMAEIRDPTENGSGNFRAREATDIEKFRFGSHHISRSRSVQATENSRLRTRVDEGREAQ